MKYLLLLLISTNCWAKEYHFVWNLQTGNVVQTLEYKVKADTYKQAHNEAALFCGGFFADRMPATEDAKWEIFDVCLNPREK